MRDQRISGFQSRFGSWKTRGIRFNRYLERHGAVDERKSAARRAKLTPAVAAGVESGNPITRARIRGNDPDNPQQRGTRRLRVSVSA